MVSFAWFEIRRNITNIVRVMFLTEQFVTQEETSLVSMSSQHGLLINDEFIAFYHVPKVMFQFCKQIKDLC